MKDKRWTTDPVINDFLEKRKPPPEHILKQHFMARMRTELDAPKVSEPAPGFCLERLEDDDSGGRRRVDLQEYNGRNLALIFGTYTCPVFRGHTSRLNEIFDELHQRLEFLLIYSKEVHTADGWQVSINEDQGIVYNRPQTAGERAAIATRFVNSLHVRMPVALDDMSDSVCTRYAGSPERLYLINGEGIIKHRSERGPYKLPVVESWYKVLKKACRN